MTWRNFNKGAFGVLSLGGWARGFVCFVVGIFLPCGAEVAAQRLQIDVPQTSINGTFVIYGRLSDEGVTVFETFHPWPENEALMHKAPARAEAQASRGALATRFELDVGERAACEDAPRVRGMIDIVAALKTRISGVTLRYGEEWETCAKRIIARLGDVAYQTEDPEADHEAKLVLLTRLSPSENQTPRIAAATGERESVSRPWRVVKVMIDERVVAVNEEGWFVFLTNTLREHAVVLGHAGQKLVSQVVYPVPLADRPSPVAGSSIYTERTVLFGQPLLDASIVAIPPVDRSYIVDAGLGLGFGYGREIPGEVRGRRLFSQAGLESRALFGPVGLKLMGSYTSADASVVPWTATARGLGFVDRPLWSGRMILRLGAGVEYFQAEIKRIGGTLRTTSDVFIPEQVLAPLTMASAQSVLFGWLVVGMHGYYTPLYVLDVGKFYPSYNVVLEWGVRFPGDWLVTIASGTETHRYPGLERDTRLNIDSSILSVKKGLF